MKHTKLMLTMMLMLLSGLAAAQLNSDGKIVAQVPFEFTVANKIVPAGQCTVQSASANTHVLLIRNVGARSAAMAPAWPDETKKAASHYALVFHRYGNQYFLTGIAMEGTKATYKLPQSKAEAELRAQNALSTQEVVLASLKPLQ